VEEPVSTPLTETALYQRSRRIRRCNNAAANHGLRRNAILASRLSPLCGQTRVISGS